MVAVIYVQVEQLDGIQGLIGEVATDCVITDLTARIRSVIRSRDVLTRVENDLFTIVIDDVTRWGAARIAQRIRGVNAVATLTHTEIPVRLVVRCEMQPLTTSER